MPTIQAGPDLKAIARQWHDLAERRLACYEEIYRSGRWQHYFRDARGASPRRMLDVIAVAKTFRRLAGLPAVVDARRRTNCGRRHDGACASRACRCCWRCAAAAPAAAAADLKHGEELLQTNCASCHAVGRTGDSPHKYAPAFRTLGQRYPIESLEEALGEGIVSGHPDMPEFKFDADDVGDIIAYLKSIQQPLTPSGARPSPPTRSVSHERALFSPVSFAGLDLANRIVVSPMCQYSADDGCANDWHLIHLGMMANSGASLVVVEATHVERRGRITHGCLGLYSDDNEAALARVIASARRAGTAKFGIQLAHSGRKGSAQRPWEGVTSLKPER